jgi:hypothetical protein
MAICINFTLVMHPVGQHLDVFANDETNLENHICFCFPFNKFVWMLWLWTGSVLFCIVGLEIKE